LKDHVSADRRSQFIGAAGTALLGLLLWLTPPGRGLVHLSYDLPFSLRVDTYADDAVIAYLDEASCHELLQPPSPEKWNRDLHAQFIDRMAAWKARAVVFDLPFEQASTNDHLFLQAAAAYGRVAVGAFRPLLASPRNAEAVVQPFAGLQRIAVWGAALSGAETGVIRLHEPEDQIVTPLSQKAAQMVLGQAPPSPLVPRWIYYYGPPGVFSSFSYADVLGDRLPAEVFSNKVVFVGSSLAMG
jgi:CHASE2 domain-containing sensor protein